MLDGRGAVVYNLDMAERLTRHENGTTTFRLPQPEADFLGKVLNDSGVFADGFLPAIDDFGDFTLDTETVCRLEVVVDMALDLHGTATAESICEDVLPWYCTHGA